MTARLQVYTCGICGNMVEVLRAGDGTLVCCGQPMTVRAENTTDAAQEKHVPVMEKAGGEAKVSVGSVAHPMTADHYIEWIEILSGDVGQRVFLNPGDEPTATFGCPGEGVRARAYCNLHGLWRADEEK